MGGDLEDSSRGTNAQSFSQTGQDAHDEFDLGVFAVEARAVGLQKVSFTGGTVELVVYL
jgi:hypothetical protein